MNKKCALALLLSICSYTASAQKDVIMAPSPNPTSLAKYIDRPVSYYTGIPEIKIPLWSVNLKNYTLPIELAYHSGGVKVEEEASSVGLGWSLISGGVITRSVRDLPDDYNKGEVLKRQDDRLLDYSPNAEHPRIGRFWSGKYETLRDFDFSNEDKNYVIKNLQASKANYETAFGSLQGNNDIEPDVFYFSFGNKSGKFIFDVNGKIQEAVMIPYQDIVISHTLSSSGEISSFTIKDNDGTEYLFDKIERMERVVGSNTNEIWAYNYTGGSGTDHDLQSLIRTRYNSSWYLSQIKTIYKEIVSFTYADEELFQYDRPMVGGITGKYNNGLTYNGAYFNFIGSNESATKKRITKIETEKETINFLSDHLRQDQLKSSYALTDVEIVNKFTGSKIKTYSIDYSYFQSPLSEVFTGLSTALFDIPAQYVPTYYKRLKLDKITEKGENNVANPPYIFEYDQSVALPHRFSFQQDLWGYFNGAADNKNLFPKLYIYPSFSGNDRFRVYPLCYTYSGSDNYILPGSDRLPNNSVMTSGTLKKVTYPTGGHTDFVFEPNSFYDDQCNYTGGGLRIKSIKNYSSALADVASTSRSYTYLNANQDGQPSGRIVALPSYADQNLSQTKYFSFSQSVLGGTSGSMVGYQSVTERSDNGINNGSTRYEYSMPALYNEKTDAEYNLYRISQPKWTDNVTAKTLPGNGYQEFLNYKNAYHLVPNTAPFSLNPDYDWNRGKLIKESHFNSSGGLVKEMTNLYKIYDGPSWKGSKNVYGLAYNFIGYSENNHQYSMVYSKYEYLTNRANVIDSTIVKTYNPSAGTIIQAEKYNYSKRGHMNPIEKITSLSNGSIKIQKTLFPYDYLSDSPLDPGILAMRKRNYIAIPIEEIVYILKDNQRAAISGNFMRYRISNDDYILPGNIAKVETTEPITNFRESHTYFEDIRPDGRYKEFFSYDEFDARGNLVQSTAEKSMIKTYIWGAGKKNPVAEIVNSRKTDVAYAGFEGEINGGWSGIEVLPVDDSGGFLGNCSYDLGLSQQALLKQGLSPSKTYELSFWTTNPAGTIVKKDSQQISGSIGATRRGYTYVKFSFSGSSSLSISGTGSIDELKLYPADASMTTCTLDPLIGIKNKTDDKGQTTYYEYDNFQRLKNVKDQNGNIIKNYDYHYKP
ncbi:hypothetical protein [Pedobacter cryoconitis]|uniref:hypothetical protein n=1 Tax=Pedobacter cryoconitis TaxID=188932 RepID=UPI0016124CF8|nr:hypothetical protein [Pedobacter cryoconitis]MBB5644209.1 hypothetical protein [Pedobacter cryoconitis]